MSGLRITRRVLAQVPGAPPPPPGFVNDTFSGANGVRLGAHTGETGATWTAHPSSTTPNVSSDFFIDANRIYASVSNLIYYASGTPATAEYDVTGLMHLFAGGGGGSSGICGRMDTTANTFYMARYNRTNQTWELFKRVAGTFTSLGTWAETAWEGSDRTCLLQIRDAAKKVFIDGVERISSADNAITAAGRVGLRSGEVGSSGVALHIDSLTGVDA